MKIFKSGKKALALFFASCGVFSTCVRADNGFLSMNRNVILRLCRIVVDDKKIRVFGNNYNHYFIQQPRVLTDDGKVRLLPDDNKVRVIMGMCEEIYNWKTHNIFTSPRKYNRAALAAGNEKASLLTNKEICNYLNAIIKSKGYKLDELKCNFLDLSGKVSTEGLIELMQELGKRIEKTSFSMKYDRLYKLDESGDNKEFVEYAANRKNNNFLRNVNWEELYETALLLISVRTCDGIFYCQKFGASGHDICMAYVHTFNRDFV
ncbi:hypothetical protein FACS189465_0750 [Clostridia bacterium]|nr:hypothetical protein FACS189465_0750 [Clostridia bacterium]